MFTRRNNLNSFINSTSVDTSTDTIISELQDVDIETAITLNLKDNIIPSFLAITVDHTLTEAQFLANKFICNRGALNNVTVILPIISYPITRTFIISEPYTLSVKPPNGKILDTTILPSLNINEKVTLPAIIHNKLVVTSVPIGEEQVYTVDVVRGTPTNGGV